jgi:hypothetical protein
MTLLLVIISGQNSKAEIRKSYKVGLHQKTYTYGAAWRCRSIISIANHQNILFTTVVDLSVELFTGKG